MHLLYKMTEQEFSVFHINIQSRLYNRLFEWMHNVDFLLNGRVLCSKSKFLTCCLYINVILCVHCAWVVCLPLCDFPDPGFLLDVIKYITQQYRIRKKSFYLLISVLLTRRYTRTIIRFDFVVFSVQDFW